MHLPDLIRAAKTREISLHRERMRFLDTLEQQALCQMNRFRDAQDENHLLRQLADPNHDGLPFADTLEEECE